MNLGVKCELLTVVLISLATLSIQSPLIDDQTSSTEHYLITRDDVHMVLSNIIKPADNVALLSDFDGTLSIMNSNPALTEILPENKVALEDLETRSNIAIGIISGRPMFNVQAKVGIKNATYSGNHGMDILFTNKTEFHYPITPEMYANCRKIKHILLTEYGNDTYYGIVEDKNISLVYHYSLVPEDVREQVLAEVRELVVRYGYVPMEGHGSIEIKPPVDWTKGNAALLILNELYGSDWEENVRVLYMGDDTSDEDVMRMLKGKGTTFRITLNPDFETHATYKMESVRTGTFILEWLVNNTIF